MSELTFSRRHPRLRQILHALPERPTVILLLLAGLAALSYANTWSVPFEFDDMPNIVNNRRLRTLSTALLDLSGSRAVGSITFAFNYAVDGFNVRGYHLVNLLIHVTNGWLVYHLVILLGRTPGLRVAATGPWVAVTTAMVFVVHPIQTQAVTYVVQRFTSLAALFYLLAIICYLHWRVAPPEHRHRRWWYAAALVSTILAMKTKENSFTLPVMILLVEWIGFRPHSRWWPLAPFLLTMSIIPLASLGNGGGSETGFARETMDISRWSYFCTQLRVIVTYLRLLLVPVQQNLDYDYPVYDSILDPPVFLSGLGLLGLLGGGLYLVLFSARWRLVGLGVTWFFLTLSVESSIIPIRDVLFEHRLYLPSVGLMLTGSVGGGALLTRSGVWTSLVAGLLVTVLAGATYQRNRVWKDEITLWKDVVAHSPLKARAHKNLGNAYATHERQDEAMQAFEAALRLKPDFPDAHKDLGVSYVKRGQLNEAIEHFMTAIALRPNYPEAHNDLGNLYADQGRWDAAILEYRKTIQLQSDFPKAHNNLGTAYAAQGRVDEAIEEYLAEIRLEPDSPSPHHNLANAYLGLGQLQKAIQEYQTVLRLQPDFPEAHYGLGNVYARQGRWEAAIQEYVTAIRLRPDFPEALYNLGNVYRLNGWQDRAREQYERALRLQPDFRAAQQALRSLDGPAIAGP